MRRFKGSGRSAVIIIFALGGGLVGAWLAKGSSGGSCYRAVEDRRSTWRVVFGQDHHCISLVDPYVADPGTLESSVRPRLINDPAGALRTLHPRVRALDPGSGGVATVRFHLTGDGIVRNPLVAGSSGLGAMDEAIAAIATDFEFAPGTASDPAEVPMEYVVGFEADRRGRLVRWLSAIGN